MLTYRLTNRVPGGLALIVLSEAMQNALLLGHDSWMRFSDYAPTAHFPHARAVIAFLVTSRYRNKLHRESSPSSRMFRLQPTLITSFTRGPQEPRFLVTTNSSKLFWFTVTARPL